MDDILGAEVDEEGFLVNLGDWTREIAEQMAKDDDIVLAEEHWQVIDFLREYFDEYQIAPAVRVLTKAIGKNLVKKKEILSTCTLCFLMAQVSRDVALLVCQNLQAAFRILK